MKFRLNWTNLLSDKRYVSPNPAVVKGTKLSLLNQKARTEFERDYDRIIFSTPFRRLAGKTQVHPFAEVDHIHNRLTHTLEVASVGRSLASAIGQFLIKKNEIPKDRTIEDIVYIVQAACLAHDIGNPPFGHAGEFVIREWTKAHTSELFGDNSSDTLHGIACDWMHFEGNAQAFRMMSKEDDREQSYFRLTYATLGTLVKYPWNSRDPRSDQVHKLGVFSSEESIFTDVTETLGLRRPDGEVVRHPLSYLSEVADDICYRITDFEDAVQMKILPEREVRKIFKKIIGSDTNRPLTAMRAQAITCLIEEAILTFEKHYEKIMCGQRPWSSDLKCDFPKSMQDGLDIIKARYDLIFSHRRKIATELGAYNTLGRILGEYTKAVKDLNETKHYDKLSFVQKRCVDLAWGKTYVQKHRAKDYAWWLGRVMDFVAGMTDNYAAQVSSEIVGTQKYE